MGVFCDRLKLCSTAAPDCWTGQNKGRYCKQELSFLLVLLSKLMISRGEPLGQIERKNNFLDNFYIILIIIKQIKCFKKLLCTYMTYVKAVIVAILGILRKEKVLLFYSLKVTYKAFKILVNRQSVKQVYNFQSSMLLESPNLMGPHQIPIYISVSSCIFPCSKQHLGQM